jgi:hypothetical protein
MEKSPPADATDFAKKLLDGAYSGETGELAKSNLREQLLDGIQKKAGQLKRAQTKEVAPGGHEANASDIANLATVYTQNKGDLDTIATTCGASAELLKKHPPVSAEDFAKKLLAGDYTGDSSEIAKSDFRNQLLEGLTAQASKLKKAPPSPSSNVGPAQSDIDCVAKIYTQSGGNLESIAASCGANLDMLKKHPPSDAQDFAKRMLDGQYTGDSTGFAKAQLRDRLCEDLQEQAKHLKRTNTKECGDGPSDADLDCVAKVYDENKGDLDKIADVCGISASLLKTKPPSNAKDFAAKLLAGAWSADSSDLAKRSLRDNLLEDLKAKAARLNHTEVKEAIAAPDASDIEWFAKVYTDKQGDLDTLAQVIGLDPAFLKKTPPKDATDFAKHLLSGDYTGDSTALAVQTLRSQLLEGLQQQAGKLRRTNTKETGAITVPAESDVDVLAKLYTQHRGSVSTLANITGADPVLMQRSPPADAQDFGKKMLRGLYAQTSECW